MGIPTANVMMGKQWVQGIVPGIYLAKIQLQDITNEKIIDMEGKLINALVYANFKTDPENYYLECLILHNF